MPDTRPDIRFWHRGRILSIEGISPQRTVLRWLREDLGLLGTKEGCAEGDCGACTVAVGSLDPSAPQGVRIQAVNSCLLFLPALDGKALFTVEDVASGTNLHPVQRALVDLHASQCGFCTPGFVMSLWADYQQRTSAPSRSASLTTLSGNLCRCTGYRPLIEAAQAAWSHPVVLTDRDPIRDALKSIEAANPLDYHVEGKRWSAPRSVESFAAHTERFPDSRVVAGATDLALRVTKGLKDLGPLVSVGSVADLRTISAETDLVIGAAVSLTDAFQALNRHVPSLAEWADRFASTPVRNAGTLGGNVANGSPIGDSLPVLLALRASVVLRQGFRERTLPLDEFYLGYQKNALKPGEVLIAVRIPPLSPETVFRVWKVSKRRDQDISALSGAFSTTLVRDRLVNVRVAFGGLAATARRALSTEKALEGQPFSEETLSTAREAIAFDFQPLTDGRASDAYRSAVAANLVTRYWDELSQGPRA